MTTSMIRVLSIVFLALTGTAHAQSNPVVVELFTSQGCSSCPPADQFLAEMVGRDDVLPLAMHVDYWDRLGWKDTLGHEAFTKRQYAYGRAFSNRSVWTPQFVVQGLRYSRGEFRGEVAKFLKEARARQAKVALNVSQSGDGLKIAANPLANDLPPMVISVVSYSARDLVEIQRGENAGKTIEYRNTVTSWTPVGTWNGRAPATLNAPAGTPRPFAVIVQAEGNGPIFAAADFK